MTSPPTGTVTFLFTDIAGSTRLWEERPAEMRAALAEHDGLVRGAIGAYNGYVFSTGGDGFAAAFSRAADAIDAASMAQAALADHPLIRVRMGIHTGEVQERDGDYFGPAVNRAARITAAGHGGQVLVSDATRHVLDGVDLQDLGEHRLRDLSRPLRLFQFGASTFPRLHTVDAFSTNLVPQLTEFVGRVDELADLARLLGKHRLVTLTGAGGAGKTRLALHAAAEALPRFGDGVWVVELAGVADEDELPAAVAAVLDLQQRADHTVTESILAVLSDRQALLVLDNCEHLIDASADFIAALLAGSREVTVLATSREGLGLEGERLVAVRPLAVPEVGEAAADMVAGVDAVRLFCARATAANAGFSLTDDNAGDVAQLCRQLDGLPLALELAASRMRAMTPGDVLSRLDERFRLLAGGRGARRRHQTLQAAIDWSYELLPPVEQLLLCRLSVFAGGFRADSAESVCSGEGVSARDVLDVLSHLVDKSLVVADTSGTSARYRMLESIREYGLLRLDPAKRGRLRDVHAAHMVELAHHIDEGVRGPEEAHWVRRLREELDNIRVAFAHLDDCGRVDDAAQLAVSLVWPGVFRMGYGLLSYSDRALDLLRDEDHPLRPQLTAAAGMRAALMDDRDRARSMATAIAERPGLPPLMYLWLEALLIASTGDFAASIQCFERLILAGESAADPLASAAGLGLLVAVQTVTGDVAPAVQNLSKAQALAARTNNPTARALASYAAAHHHGFGLGDQATAVTAAEAALRLARSVDNQSWQIFAAQALIELHLVRGEDDAVIAAMRPCLDDCTRFGLPSAALFNLPWALLVLQRRNETELSAVLYGFLMNRYWQARSDVLIGESVTALKATLGPAEFERLADLGRQCSLDEIVRLVRAALSRLAAGASDG